MANEPNNNQVFECFNCPTRFASSTQHVADCNITPPSPVTTRIFNRAGNVYWEERDENPFTTSISVPGQERRALATMTKAFCSGCGTPCGWKIVSVGTHDLLRRGQYILQAKTINE